MAEFHVHNDGAVHTQYPKKGVRGLKVEIRDVAV